MAKAKKKTIKARITKRVKAIKKKPAAKKIAKRSPAKKKAPAKKLQRPAKKRVAVKASKKRVIAKKPAAKKKAKVSAPKRAAAKAPAKKKTRPAPPKRAVAKAPAKKKAAPAVAKASLAKAVEKSRAKEQSAPAVKPAPAPTMPSQPTAPAAAAAVAPIAPISLNPAEFCWAELNTTDARGSKEFYTQLFGWEAHDDAMPQGGVYTMLTIGGGNAAALYSMNAEQRSQKVPSHWNTYMKVDNVDVATARARQLGGKVMAGPFDVADAGRMSFVVDPTGAPFHIWEARKHAGFVFTDNRPGTVTWNELSTPDTAKAGAFYAALFNWQKTDMPMGPNDTYTLFQAKGKNVGGMMKLDEEMVAHGIPPTWTIYFSVSHCDTAVARARSLGASIEVEPTDIPNTGRFAIIQDPAGAIFGVLQPIAM